jgi:hypothetical protein
MRQTIAQRRALARLEKRRAEAERSYKATRKAKWLARLQELTTACLRAA